MALEPANLFELKCFYVFKTNVTPLAVRLSSRTGLSVIGWRLFRVMSYLSGVLRLVLVDKIHQEKPKEQQDR